MEIQEVVEQVRNVCKARECEFTDCTLGITRHARKAIGESVSTYRFAGAYAGNILLRGAEVKGSCEPFTITLDLIEAFEAAGALFNDTPEK